MKLAELKIGDKATLRGFDGAPRKILTVRSVGRLKITCDDGSEWLVRSGHAWGTANDRGWYTSDRLTPYEDGDDLNLQLARDRALLGCISWEATDAAFVTEVAALYRKRQAELEKKA